VVSREKKRSIYIKSPPGMERNKCFSMEGRSLVLERKTHAFIE
jgi:hypothetical protein